MRKKLSERRLALMWLILARPMRRLTLTDVGSMLYILPSRQGVGYFCSINNQYLMIIRFHAGFFTGEGKQLGIGTLCFFASLLFYSLIPAV